MKREYLRAVARRFPAALYDVALIAGIGLLPILVGRIVLVLPNSPHLSAEPYLAFLTNGQMAFYSIGTIAALLLVVFDEKIPKSFGKLLMFGCVASLFFLAALVGIDPTLKSSSFSFVGTTTLGIYLAALLVRALVEAIKGVDDREAREAGDRATKTTTDGLAERMGAQ